MNRRVMYDAMPIILLLAIIGVGFAIISHDYPGPEHLAFLHNLLRDDAAIKQMPPLVALNAIAEPNAVRSHTKVHLINNLCHFWHHKQGSEYLWSALEFLPFVADRQDDSMCHADSSDPSPPSDNIVRVGGYYPYSRCVILSSDHIKKNAWFRHISLFFSSSVMSAYLNIGSTEKDRPLFHDAMSPFAGANNAAEMQKLPEAA